MTVKKFCLCGDRLITSLGILNLGFLELFGDVLFGILLLGELGFGVDRLAVDALVLRGGLVAEVFATAFCGGFLSLEAFDFLLGFGNVL